MRRSDIIELIDEATLDVLRLAEDWKRGVPPVAGGSLDQTESIAQACEYVWREEAAWEAKLWESSKRR